MSMGAWGESCNTFYDTEGLKQSNIAEESPNEEGWYPGVWKIFLKNGELKSQGKYLYKNNFQKAYYETGELFVEVYAVDCLNEGSYKQYWKNGKIKMEGSYDKNEAKGLWKYYFKKGNLKSEGILEDGLKNGDWTFYHPNGSISTKGSYNAGKRFSFSKSYSDDGILLSEGNYVLGKKDGDWNYYFLNGNKRGSLSYNMGVRVGPVSINYPDGSIECKAVYLDDSLEGVIKNFYQNGKLRGEAFFKKGKVSGEAGLFNQDGKLSMYAKYENGLVKGIRLAKGEQKISDNFINCMSRNKDGELSRTALNKKGDIINLTTHPLRKVFPQFIIAQMTVSEIPPFGYTQLSWSAPQYPRRMQERGIQGCVMLQFTVDKKGETKDIIALWSHPNFESDVSLERSRGKEFVYAALQSAKKYRYNPAVDEFTLEPTEAKKVKTIVVFRMEGSTSFPQECN